MIVTGGLVAHPRVGAGAGARPKSCPDAQDVPDMYNKSCYANGNHLVTLDRKYLLRACPKAVEHLTKWKEEREVRKKEEAEKEKQAELEHKRLAEANAERRTGALRNKWTSWMANSRHKSRKKNAEI